MSSKNTTDVIIGGKVITLRGYESAEYLQKVATYINNILTEYQNNDAYRKLNVETQTNYIYLNIADDYFKAKDKCDELTQELAQKDKTIYDIKHELIEAKMKLEADEKKIKELKAENSKFQKSIVKLETELNGLKD